MINYEEDLRLKPQSHDELDVDYDILPPKGKVIVAILFVVTLAGILYLAFHKT